MADLVVVFGVLAFFAISALLVIGCDRIIGPDTDARASYDRHIPTRGRRQT